MTLDKIQLNDLEIACVIGVNAEERITPQKVCVSAELSISTQAAAMSDYLGNTVDYEFVAIQIQFLLQDGQFFLIETACHALCRTLLLPPVTGESRPAVECVKLRLCKPDGLKGRAYPSLEVVRHRTEMAYSTQRCSFGTAEVVVETPHLGIYRNIVAPGNVTAPGRHPNHEESTLLLSDGLQLSGERTARGTIRRCPPHTVEVYRNDTNRYQALLRLCRPPLPTE